MGRLDPSAAQTTKLSDENRERCLRELDDILGLDPTNVETLHVRACVFLLEENFQACLEDLEQVKMFLE